jgi:hypothetical protein
LRKNTLWNNDMNKFYTQDETNNCQLHKCVSNQNKKVSYQSTDSFFYWTGLNCWLWFKLIQASDGVCLFTFFSIDGANIKNDTVFLHF